MLGMIPWVGVEITVGGRIRQIQLLWESTQTFQPLEFCMDPQTTGINHGRSSFVEYSTDILYPGQRQELRDSGLLHVARLTPSLILRVLWRGGVGVGYSLLLGVPSPSPWETSRANFQKETKTYV